MTQSNSSDRPESDTTEDAAAVAGRVAAAATQLVEHVDETGSVIEIVSRAEMRARSLRHRSVYIAVVDSQHRLLVHKRADWKDIFPGAWDLAFGGVCDVGEDWRVAAQRELLEEAGVTGHLVDRGAVSFEAPGVALIGRLYALRHDGPFTFDDGEVIETKWLPINELAAFVAAHRVPPDSELIITAAAIGPVDGLVARSPSLTAQPTTVTLTSAQSPREFL